MKQPGNNEDWSACPTGTFERFRDELPGESRQRSVKPYVTALSMGAVLAATLFGLTLLGGKAAPPVDCDVLCGEVIALLPDYIAQKTDKATTLEIEEHLEYCVVCQDRLAELREQMATLAPNRRDDGAVRRPLIAILLSRAMSL